MEYKFYLIIDNVTTEIEEPLGWDRIEFSIKRDLNLHGVFIEYSSSLDFINSGYQLIKDTVDNYGFDYKIEIEIFVNCGDGNFISSYKGVLDNPEFNTDDFCSVTCNLLDFSEKQRLKKLQDAEFNVLSDQTLEGLNLIPLNQQSITLHSKAIILESLWKNTRVDSNAANLSTQLHSIKTFPIGAVVRQDIPITATTFSIPQLINNNNDLDAVDKDNYLIEAKFSGIYKVESLIKGIINVQVNAGTYNFSSMRLFFLEYTKGGQRNIIINDELFVPDPLVNAVNANFGFNNTNNFDIFLEEGSKLVCLIQFNNFFVTNISGPLVAVSQNIEFGNVRISQTSIIEDSNSKGIFIYEAFMRLAQNVLNKETAFKSFIFNRIDRGAPTTDKLAQFFITNGYLIRQYPQKELLLNLKDFFVDTDKILNLGLGLENDNGNMVIRVEKKEEFYLTDEVVFIAENVKGYKKEIAKEFVFSKLDIGFKNYGTEEGTDKKNTADSFSTIHKYLSPVRTEFNNIEKLSNLVADGYTIEYTRRKSFEESGTESWKFDENNFILAVNDDLNRSAKDEDFEDIQNILSPETAYNLIITPKRNLLRHLNYLSAGYANISGRSLKFLQGLVNDKLQSKVKDSVQRFAGDYNQRILLENQTVQWDDNNVFEDVYEPMFSPFYVSFTYPLSFAEYNFLKQQPYQLIGYSFNNSEIKLGWIIDIIYKLEEGLAEFKLIEKYDREILCAVTYWDDQYAECGYVD